MRLTYRYGIALGLAASVATLVAGALARRSVESIDLRLYDAVISAVPIGDGTLPGVAIVTVDDASLAAMGRWPWPRTEVARLVDTLAARGATVIAFDLLLAEPDRPNVSAPNAPRAGLPHDEALAIALARTPTVVGHALTFDGPRPLDAAPCGATPPSIVRVQGRAAEPPGESFFTPTGAVCSLDAFGLAADASGFLNAGPDPDGVMRRVPLLVRAGEDLYPSLALAAVIRAHPDSTLSITRTTAGDLGLRFGSRLVHLDAQGTKLIPFRGRSGTAHAFSAVSALEGRLPPDAVRGRIVLLGGTALGLGDVVSTPIDVTYPGVEVHATVVAALLDGRFVDSPSWSRGLVMLFTLLVGPAIGALVVWRTLLVGGLATALVAVGGPVTALALMSARGLWVSPLLPTVASVASLATVLLVRARAERARAAAERFRRDQTQRFALQSLMALVDIRDHSTGQHARRTAAYAALLAGELRKSPRFTAYLTDAALAVITELAPLHDIGKVGVPDAVLNKPGPLSDDEYGQMKRHPELGYQTILRAEKDSGLDPDLEVSVLRIAKELVRSHHERWDGRGYPRALAGEEIPIPARIMALVDVYDALVQPRVYRAAMTHEQARALVLAGKGTSFDPDLVDAFVAVEEDFRALTLRYREDVPSA